MKITDIKIDGFGVWHDLTLRGLSPELTAFYGPNEAGKSTLMQFMRSILYGVSPTRRERYLPPVNGGRAGGWLKVQSDDGPLTISRYADRGPNDVGKVTVITAEGEEQGDRLLREALEHVDEPTYLNIFAVGLREVQELTSLSDTAAAQWLYRLTSGLDRISLYDVIHMLAGTRTRLLNGAEEKSELRTLHSRREQLRGELDELVAKGRRWAQSAVKLRELAEEVERRQAESKALNARGRRLEVAINIKPLWIKRTKIDDQLDRFLNLRPLEDDAIPTLDDFNQRIEEHERQRDILRGQRRQLIEEARRLGINDALMRAGARIDALLEQVEWLQAIERAATELADEVDRLEKRLASENERLSHEWTGAGKIPPRITTEMVEGLAPQSRAIEATEGMLDTARHELELLRAGEHEFRAQIESAMTSGTKFGLPKDIESASDLVAQLRRRQQVEQRIESARRQADDLQRQTHDLVEEQVVPMHLFSWLLAVFALGFMGVTAWWLIPTATIGKYFGWIALLGFVASIFAFAFKHFTEWAASERFENCHRQIELAQDQIDDAEDEKAKLDRELPLTEGSVALRLQHAERHLAELERVLPVESQRREAEEGITACERRVKLAEEKHSAALGNWKAKLRALGLPDDLSPASLGAMAGQCERLIELEARIENRRDDMGRRQREFAVVSQRIIALAEETGLVLTAPIGDAGKKKQHDSDAKRADNQAGSSTHATVGPLAQLDHLRTEYHKNQQRVEQRKSLRERGKALRHEQAKHGRAAIGLRRRRTALFQKCGVEDEHELRALAAKHEEVAELRKKRETATREIAVAIGKHGTEADFAPMLTAELIGRLEHDWETLSTQLETLDRELKDALQRRGAMVEQQRAAAADHSLAKKQIELDVVEQEIEKASAAWRERAVVSVMLERIRKDYEAHRQPETLREASEYMRQLTGGKYTRIWTPLAHDILFVDNAEGQALSVQVLSRGTREQLFVSLRLALVSAYARRGIHLPMILDDVFVNFDATRTRTACAVLRDFAKQGHQLLVFTCHEHVWQMFRDLKIDSRRIPNRFGETPEPEEAPQPEPVVKVVAVEPEPVPVPEPPKVIEVKAPIVEEVPLIIEEPEMEEVLIEEIIEEEVPAEVRREFEFSWDDFAEPALPQVDLDDDLASGWLPEPIIYPQRR